MCAFDHIMLEIMLHDAMYISTARLHHRASPSAAAQPSPKPSFILG